MFNDIKNKSMQHFFILRASELEKWKQTNV